MPRIGSGLACAGLVFLAASLLGLPATAQTDVPASISVPSDEARFAAFVHDFRDEALKAGIKPETYDRAMAGISLNAKVQDLNLNQPEFVRPVWEYLAGAVSDARVKKGKDLIQANAPLFARLEQDYGVPKEVLTAIWGMESAYGASQGTFNLFEALATLAYDGPRAAYGRRQLIAALKVAEVEARDPTTMVGSWAGAFGETQFVPTTFLERAVDGDGDGKRDVWNSPADALASTANYLKLAGWRPGEPWGEEVELPADFPFDQADADIRKSESDWGMLGVRTIAGAPLNGETVRGWIFLPAGHRGPVFFIRENFDAILKYNLATSYALAVSLLADRFKDEGKIAAAWPVDESPLDQSSRLALQTGLNALGYMVGEPDGVLGRRSRQAIRDYQKDRGLPADGFATAALLTRILNERYLRP
jgi:membrane-bound lytic murein transglycosylase B